MKLGIHLSTFTTTWGENVLPFLSTAAAMGYDGVEFPVITPRSFPVKEANQLMRRHGVSCTCGTGLNPSTDISSEVSTCREAGEAHLKSCIDVAAELESPLLAGVTYQAWGARPDRSAERTERMAEILHRVARHGERRGVRLGMELLNRYEGSLVNTVDDGLALLDAVDHPWVGLHLDTFHSALEEKNLPDAIHRAGDRLFHVHACENDRGTPGSGGVPWQAVMSTLRSIGYDGWITLECFVVPGCEVGRQVSVWRPIAPSAHETAQNGGKYLRTLMKDVL